MKFKWLSDLQGWAPHGKIQSRQPLRACLIFNNTADINDHGIGRNFGQDQT